MPSCAALCWFVCPSPLLSLRLILRTPPMVKAGGNDALALLLTVTTNLLGVVTVPFFVKAVVKSGDASIDGVELLIKLVRQSCERPSNRSSP